MRHNRAHAVSFAILAASTVAASASASFVTVQCPGVGAGRNVSVTLGGTVRSVFAGQILLNLSNSSEALNGSWKSFCTELSQYIHVDGAAQQYQVVAVSQVPNPGPGMGQARADAIARMFNAANGAQYGANSDLAAAFQIAVWEVAIDYDGTVASLSLAAGNLQGPSLSAEIMGNMTSLLAAAGDTSGLMANIIGLGNTNFQDQIIDPAAAIPTPGALAMLGLAGIIGLRRRRK
jgi:MYXO-CTERM domain-containing protein